MSLLVSGLQAGLPEESRGENLWPGQLITCPPQGRCPAVQVGAPPCAQARASCGARPSSASHTDVQDVLLFLLPSYLTLPDVARGG